MHCLPRGAGEEVDEEGVGVRDLAGAEAEECESVLEALLELFEGVEGGEDELFFFRSCF